MNTWERRNTVWLVVLLALATVAAFGWASLAQRPHASDFEQIRELFVRGERAIEGHKLSDAFRLISRNYRDDSGLRYEQLRALSARRMQELQSIDINVPSRFLKIDVAPDGQHATAQARVEVRTRDRSGSVEEVKMNLSFQLVKEPARRYLVFPTRQWRIVKSEGWQGMIGE